MSRNRMIKPDFWSDDAITECSIPARLLFIATWNFADDEGNLKRSARQLKAQAFPCDNIDCEPLINELIAHGLLIEYSVSDEIYLHIKNFKKHQVINRPSKPSCPIFNDSLSTHGVLNDDSLSTHAQRKGKERKEITQSRDKRVFIPPIPDDLLKDWVEVRKKKRATAITERVWKAIEREAGIAGWTVEQAITKCCEKSWVSFEASWVRGQPKPVDNSKPEPFDLEAQNAAIAEAIEKRRLHMDERKRAILATPFTPQKNPWEVDNV